MTRALFEKTASDMDMDISRSKGFDRYINFETQKAWILWNLALQSKEAQAEPEPPVEVSLEGIHIANLYFDWGQDHCGFGQLHVSKHEDGTVGCMNEGMSRRWVRRALHSAIDVLVDNAKLDD